MSEIDARIQALLMKTEKKIDHLQAILTPTLKQTSSPNQVLSPPVCLLHKDEATDEDIRVDNILRSTIVYGRAAPLTSWVCPVCIPMPKENDG